MPAEFIEPVIHFGGTFKARARNADGVVYTSSAAYPTVEEAYVEAERWLDAERAAIQPLRAVEDCAFSEAWLEAEPYGVVHRTENRQ